ncbi:MAG: hypothetical protein Q3962_05880 [Corynebacterium sp.]|nr:hypothetical protein [Corynebacterium sp.]
MLTKTVHSIAALGGAIFLAGVSAFSGGTAMALPPGGASSDTPGTSSYVSPTSLKACETLSYSVSGFPAGQIVYIKIDDGSASSGDQSIQGQGVVAQQRIDSSGTAAGSFSLPCDLAPGDHWLRYLAAESSSAGGTIGYSNRGDSNFTIVSSSNSDDSSSTTTATTTTAASSGSGSGSGGGSQPVTQVTVNAAGERVVVTRYVDEPADPASGNSASNSNAGVNAGGSTAATTSSNLRLGAAGSTGSGGNSGSSGTSGGSGSVVYAAGSTGKPVIGLLVGGAILIVGLLGIWAYLYVNKPRYQDGEYANF